MDTKTGTLLNRNNTDTTPEMFALENCEVAAVEGPVSAHKLCITFNRSQVYVNAEFLKRAPEMTYALFLIDSAARKLILCPCDQNERDAVRIRTMGEYSVKPRHIFSGGFNDRLFDYMQWDVSCRYKVAGVIMRDNGKTLVVFDLTSAEKFKLPTNGDVVRRPPGEPHWNENSSFGATIAERLANPMARQFARDSVISVEISDKRTDMSEPEVTK